jgi:hypothetical protein
MSVLEKLLNINTYVQDGFSKVADVRANPDTGKWELVEQSSSLYENHTSWVYAVVVGEEIVKIGETGLQLGIKKQKTDQPIAGTTNRMGRLAGFGKTFDANMQKTDTDVRIRSTLHEEALKGNVCIWAKRCDILGVLSVLYGETYKTFTTYHKQIEKAYLTRIHNKTGVLPRLNPAKI